MQLVRTAYRFATFTALALLACTTNGCVNNDWPDEAGCYAPNTDDLLERAIARWEEVDGAPVSPDFRDVILWELVEGGDAQGWHPSCPAPADTIAGCTTWDPHAFVYHVQLRWCMSRAQTERVAFHELGHALVRHHYGDIDSDHTRDAVWVDVVGWLQDGGE